MPCSELKTSRAWGRRKGGSVRESLDSKKGPLSGKADLKNDYKVINKDKSLLKVKEGKISKGGKNREGAHFDRLPGKETTLQVTWGPKGDPF